MILLVEDNEDDVFIMERAMLKLPLKHRMHVAADGRQAVDYLQGSGKYSDRLAYPIPSLIFLDLKLPFLHGFEILEWINTQRLLKNVPVAILTSSAEPKDREKAIRLGAKTFLVKPPTPETLTQVFELILDAPPPRQYVSK